MQRFYGLVEFFRCIGDQLLDIDDTVHYDPSGSGILARILKSALEEIPSIGSSYSPCRVKQSSCGEARRPMPSLLWWWLPRKRGAVKKFYTRERLKAEVCTTGRSLAVAILRFQF